MPKNPERWQVELSKFNRRISASNETLIPTRCQSRKAQYSQVTTKPNRIKEHYSTAEPFVVAPNSSNCTKCSINFQNDSIYCNGGKSNLSSLPRMVTSDENPKAFTISQSTKQAGHIAVYKSQKKLLCFILACAASTTPSTVSSLLRG